MTHSVRRVINSKIHATNSQEAAADIMAWGKRKLSCYVIPANVHLVMTGFWQKSYQTIINHAALVTPDGMLLVWTLRLLGIKNQKRVDAADLMLVCCDRAQQEKVSIYLYGATPVILAKLERNLKAWYPELIIAGSHAPPFRPPTAREAEMDIKMINESGASIVFVALGCPKQEQWMAKQVGKINAVMIGVGAAFAFLSHHCRDVPWNVSTLVIGKQRTKDEGQILLGFVNSTQPTPNYTLIDVGFRKLHPTYTQLHLD